ncbi:MAG TPA: hypothetical protein VF240_13975 [Pyrinomonadaceae bacterium]
MNIGIVLALVLGGGGGALAASLCPHADCVPAADPVMTAAAEHHDEASRGDHHGHTSEAAEGQHLDASFDTRQQNAPPATRQGVQSTHDRSCDHCVARRPAAPASELERRSDAPKRDNRVAPAPSARPVSAPAADFVTEVTPHQGAPPGRTSRHVLNNVFRI